MKITLGEFKSELIKDLPSLKRKILIRKGNNITMKDLIRKIGKKIKLRSKIARRKISIT